jgi:hypothetical protein
MRADSNKILATTYHTFANFLTTHNTLSPVSLIKQGCFTEIPGLYQKTNSLTSPISYTAGWMPAS